MNIFWTSDWHLNHYNIISYTGRPFKTLEEMNSTIISRFNERVKEDDLCFYLGDFCFKSGSGRGEGEPDKAQKFRDQLKCKNIVWIGGNHDKNNSLKTPIKKVMIRYGGKDICLVHNPEHIDWNYKFHICGHVHEKWAFKEFTKSPICNPNNTKIVHCCNVSVEKWNYYPLTWAEIDQAYNKWCKQGCKNEKTN